MKLLSKLLALMCAAVIMICAQVSCQRELPLSSDEGNSSSQELPDNTTDTPSQTDPPVDDDPAEDDSAEDDVPDEDAPAGDDEQDTPPEVEEPGEPSEPSSPEEEPPAEEESPSEDNEDELTPFSFGYSFSDFTGEEIVGGTSLVEGYIGVNYINGGSSPMLVANYSNFEYKKYAALSDDIAVTFSLPASARLTVFVAGLGIFGGTFAVQGEDFYQECDVQPGGNSQGDRYGYSTFTFELKAGEYSLCLISGNAGLLALELNSL